MRDDGNNFSSSLIQKLVCTLNGQETVWVHFLSEPVEEDGQVMEVVQLAWLYRKLNSIDGSLVIDLDGEVSSVVVPPELGGLDASPGVGACLLLAGLPHHLSLISLDGVSTGALAAEHKLIYS